MLNYVIIGGTQLLGILFSVQTVTLSQYSWNTHVFFCIILTLHTEVNLVIIFNSVDSCNSAQKYIVIIAAKLLSTGIWMIDKDIVVVYTH